MNKSNSKWLEHLCSFHKQFGLFISIYIRSSKAQTVQIVILYDIIKQDCKDSYTYPLDIDTHK